jgi:hypothetical protein
MPEMTKLDESMVAVAFVSRCVGGVATSSASSSLCLFLGRPICFWGEKIHSSFSLRHRVQFGLSPEHFNFRVPSNDQCHDA